MSKSLHERMEVGKGSFNLSFNTDKVNERTPYPGTDISPKGSWTWLNLVTIHWYLQNLAESSLPPPSFNFRSKVDAFIPNRHNFPLLQNHNRFNEGENF